MNLKNKIVLVTGAAKRIGREIAKGFALQGAHVLIHCHTAKEEAQEWVVEPTSFENHPKIYSADLGKVDQIRQMAQKILEETAGVDILVNNASSFYPTPFETTTEAQWDNLLAINLKAPFFLSQALAPAMKKRGAGRIINIADGSGLRPSTGYLPYCIAKGALITFTQGLAKALAPEILVTAVCPGPILPPPDFTEKDKKQVVKKTPVGHWGSPEDIVKMVLFLAEQDFITGSYHLVDGGESLK